MDDFDQQTIRFNLASVDIGSLAPYLNLWLTHPDGRIEKIRVEAGKSYPIPPGVTVSPHDPSDPLGLHRKDG